MSEKRHIMHGRDHFPRGADPLGTIWFYVNPISPGTADGPIHIADPAALFEDAWGNIEGYEPTAFRITESGHLGLRVVATGDEETPNSLIFNLPVGFRPAFAQRRFAVVGTGQAGIIEARSDGDVIWVGYVEAAP